MLFLDQWRPNIGTTNRSCHVFKNRFLHFCATGHYVGAMDGAELAGRRRSEEACIGWGLWTNALSPERAGIGWPPLLKAALGLSPILAARRSPPKV